MIIYYLDSFFVLKRILLIAIGLIFILTAFAGLPLYFSQASYYVSGQEIVRAAGFFVRNRQFMKTSAIQYVTLIRTPFSQQTGLNFVLINALGGHLLLPFLSRRDAEDILRSLTETLHARSS